MMRGWRPGRRKRNACLHVTRGQCEWTRISVVLCELQCLHTTVMSAQGTRAGTGHSLSNARAHHRPRGRATRHITSWMRLLVRNHCQDTLRAYSGTTLRFCPDTSPAAIPAASFSLRFRAENSGMPSGLCIRPGASAAPARDGVPLALPLAAALCLFFFLSEDAGPVGVERAADGVDAAVGRGKVAALAVTQAG